MKNRIENSLCRQLAVQEHLESGLFVASLIKQDISCFPPMQEHYMVRMEYNESTFNLCKLFCISIALRTFTGEKEFSVVSSVASSRAIFITMECCVMADKLNCCSRTYISRPSNLGSCEPDGFPYIRGAVFHTHTCYFIHSCNIPVICHICPLRREKTVNFDFTPKYGANIVFSPMCSVTLRSDFVGF